VTYLLRHLVQALSVFTAFYVCLSRVSDFRHHWSDVLCGVVIGVIVASLSVRIQLFVVNFVRVSFVIVSRFFLICSTNSN